MASSTGANGSAQSAPPAARSPAILPGPPLGRPPTSNGLSRHGPPGPPPGAPPGQQHVPAYAYPPRPPPMMPHFPAPLPPGWSEHTAPDGFTQYYYNSTTKDSTYIRPTFPGPFPSFPPAAAPPHQTASGPAGGRKKKEKPKEKVVIPGTGWTRVTTNEGNVFYFEKESKRSEWSVPEEIREEVAVLQAEEEVRRVEAEREEKERAEVERMERLKERERLREEVEEERKRKAVERERKRKEREEDGEEEEEPDAKVSKTDGEGDGEFGPQNEEDEEAWMKAVAAEFADADKALKAEQKRDKENLEREEEEAAKKVFAVPEKVNVTLEEGRALFKALLIEKDISPFAPWDQSLPLFINDPRYILLSSTKDRREVYEEYCRDIGRARRLNKPTTLVDSKKVDPEKDYKTLLREAVTSTRMRWDDFRKQWKKDRRVYSFGRDDRDREKVFKVHLRELGERKRADAQRAEQDFADLLKETEGITSSSDWSEVKRGISTDPRYDAVGSSSLRGESFAGYTRQLASTSAQPESAEEAAESRVRDRKAKEEASLRERQAKIMEVQQQVTKDMSKSRAGAGREEAERLFGSLLVDQVRDHKIPWSEAARFLEADARFHHPSLNPFDKQRLFNAHIGRIGNKRSNALHQLFATHTPSLDTRYEDVYPKLVDDSVVKRLALDSDALEDRFNAWRRATEQDARREFDIMLGENSFVEFWGRMRKKTVDEEARAVREDERGEGEGMGDGGAADLTVLAKQIDLEEIKSVLRRDKRYRQFDHNAAVREKWLRDYLRNLEAASGSKTIHTVGQER